MSDFKVGELKDLLVLDKNNDVMKTAFLITAKANDKVNTMTAAWFTVGDIWSQPVFIIMVKKSRFTHSILEKSLTFSISFLDDKNFSKLGYLGKASGRDEDKIKKADLHIDYAENTPYIDESKQVIICTKLFENNCTIADIKDKNIVSRYYSESEKDNYHTLYIGRIDQILNKKQ